jgi:hypothetical protein
MRKPRGIRNRATGVFLDGTSRTANGSVAVPYGDTNSGTQQWKIVNVG